MFHYMHLKWHQNTWLWRILSLEIIKLKSIHTEHCVCVCVLSRGRRLINYNLLSTVNKITNFTLSVCTFNTCKSALNSTAVFVKGIIMSSSIWYHGFHLKQKYRDDICEGVEIWKRMYTMFILYLWKMEDEMKGKSSLAHIEIISGNTSDNNNHYFKNSFEMIYFRKFRQETCKRKKIFERLLH